MTSDAPIPANPLGWAQLQLVGGWRRLTALSGLYAGIVLFVALLFYNAMGSDVSPADFASAALTGLFYLEAALLFFVAPSQIRRAIQRDFTTDMINSHRLTGMNGRAAVMGYLSGCTAQVMAMTCVNWLACCVFSVMTGRGPGESVMGTTVFFAILISLALLWWSFTVYLGLETRGKAGPMGFLVAIFVIVNASLIAVLPGLDFLLMVGRLGMSPMTRAALDPAAVAISVLFQICFTGILFLAAARKFARDDVPSFSVTLAYVLLAYWALICAVAWRFWPRVGWGSPSAVDFALDPANQSLVTLISLALVAGVPVGCAAAAESAWMRRRLMDPHFAPARPRRYFIAPIAATVMAFGVFLLVTGESSLLSLRDTLGRIDPVSAVCIPVAFLCALFTLAGLLRYTCALSLGPGKVSVIFFIMTWAMPIFGDLMFDAMKEAGAPPSGWMAAVVSPVGTWVCAITRADGPITAGVCVQIVFAAAMLWLGGRAPSRAAR